MSDLLDALHDQVVDSRSRRSLAARAAALRRRSRNLRERFAQGRREAQEQQGQLTLGLVPTKETTR